jgi:hypothetical protein
MSLVASMSITAAAAEALERRRASYSLRDSDVLALSYISAFRNPDGTTVAGFVPGYQISSWPRDHLGRSSVFVLLPHGTSLYLIPRSKWDVDRPHHIDLISVPHEIFSILPVSEAEGRV